uniref:receptor protein-tyrosine kinase n=1 Tax=Podocoryna carnea TaxID=6096 RepID=Q674V1_PODCA|nr:vascular endothelial growth factor receptor [Podocoryna carnea]
MIWYIKLIFLVGIIESVAGGIVFTIKKWETPIPGNPNFELPFRMAQAGALLSISCQTNDTTADVTLSRRTGSEPYVDAKETFKDTISQVGQTFFITKLESWQGGYFMCTATNYKDEEIEFEMGQLSVSQLEVPIAPPILSKSPSNTILIETNANANVTCKTNGLPGEDASILNWFRKKSEILTPIDESRVIRSGHYEKDTANHIDVEILMFKNFGKDEVGTYVCQRKLDKSNPTFDNVTIALQPDVEPSVTLPDISSNTIFIKPGIQLYPLRCSTGGSPKPNKHWAKDGQIVHKCPNIHKPDCIYSLVMTSHLKHSGIYKCVAENYLKNASKSVSVQVLDPPVLDKPTPTKVAGFERDEELYCVVKSANPMPFIKWEFQPDTCDTQTAGRCDPIEADWKPFSTQKPDTKTSTNFSSIIPTKTKSNFFYRCIAENEQGTDTYQFALVRKEQAPAQFFITPKNNRTVTEQDRLEIQCSGDLYIFKSVKITKDGIELTANETVTDNVRLTTFKVDAVSLSADGVYQCEAVLRRGGDQKVMTTIFVKKLMKPVISGFNNLEVSQDTISHMNVSCFATGHPPPDFTSKFNGKRLENISTIPNIDRCKTSDSGIYKLRNKNNVLLLCKLDYEKQQGMYQCEASNKVDTALQRRNLTILAKPKIFNSGKEWKVTLSGVVEVSCVAKANPPANVSWYRIEKDARKPISWRMGADILYVGNSVEDTSSGYNCTASNELGNVTRYVQILAGDSAVVGGASSKGTIIGVIVATVIIVLIALILILWYRRHLKKRYALFLEPNEDWQIDPDRTIFEQSSELPYDMDWEFPRSKISLIKTLGSGAFGQVWLAEAEGIHGFKPRDKSSSASKRRKSFQKGQRRRYHSLSIRYRKQLNVEEVTSLEKSMVAVKTLKDDAAEGEYKDLASELKILIHLGEHKNIVNLLGACTTNGKLYVILECCPRGNLLTFLRGKRETFQPVWTKYDTDMENEFTYIDLLMIVIQVAKRMDFLQSQKCVHRDLAARNVLVGPDYIMKIADFGLARDIYKDEFYLKETTGLLPVKWMAPESLFDKVYTSMSDIWSYGIVLWEAFTLGGSPYPGLPTEDLFGFLEDGKRMERPEICPKSVFEIMSDCWTKSPYDRPMFSQIYDRLTNVLKHNVPSDSDYLDFTDAKENDYLTPDIKANSNEYLEASAENFSPKGQTYVPPPSKDLFDESSPLPPEPTDGYVPMTPGPQAAPTDGYVPMTPGDHYQSPPSSFRYDGSDDVIV